MAAEGLLRDGEVLGDFRVGDSGAELFRDESRQALLAVENLPIIAFELAGGWEPSPLFGVVTGGLADTGVVLGVEEKAADRFDGVAWTVGIVEAAGDAVLNDVGDAAGARRDHRTTAGHGFHEDQAEGFSARSEEEGITRGIGSSELFVSEKSCEIGRRACEIALQLFAMGTVADQSQTDTGKRGEDVAAALDFLFRGKAADVEEELAFGMARGETGPHFVGGARGMEKIGVDAAAPEMDAADAMMLQLGLHGLGGGEDEVAAVVGLAHGPPHEPFEAAEAVVLEVFGQVGVVRDDERDAKPGADEEGGDAKNRGIDSVQNVGAEAPDGVPDGGARNGHFELGIERKSEAGDAVNRRTFKAVDAAGGDDQDLVAQSAKMTDGVTETGDDAVDFGEERFGDEGNAQRPGGASRCRLENRGGLLYFHVTVGMICALSTRSL